MRLAEHLLGHAPEPHLLKAATAVGAYDNEIDVVLLGVLDDLIGRVAESHVGPREKRQHSPGVGRASTGLSYSSAYDTLEQVCGRTVTIVTVRPQQILMNTRAKRRTAGVSPASPLRVGQAARLPATEQIHTAAQEEHREEQQRDLRKGR